MYLYIRRPLDRGATKLRRFCLFLHPVSYASLYPCIFVSFYACMLACCILALYACMLACLYFVSCIL